MTPLRQRMLEDMRLRKVSPKTQTAYVRVVANFTRFFGRSPDKAKAEDLRRYQLHLVEQGVSNITINATITGLKFFFEVTLDRAQAMKKMHHVYEPRKLPEVLSLEVPKDKGTARSVNLAKLYVRFKLMTGLRRSDILRLRLPELRDDGIHVQPHKTKDSTGMRLIIEWDAAGELRDLIEEILRLPPRRVGDVALFVTREGRPYIKDLGKTQHGPLTCADVNGDGRGDVMHHDRVYANQFH